MKNLVKIIGLGLLLFGIYMIFSNSNYVSEEDISKQQYFCDNHSQIQGVISDSVDVLKINQNESYTYKYDYIVDGKNYKRVAPVKSNNIGGTPPLRTTIYYQNDNPSISSTSNPCKSIDGMIKRQNKKLWYYLGFVLAILGLILNRIKK